MFVVPPPMSRLSTHRSACNLESADALAWKASHASRHGSSAVATSAFPSRERIDLDERGRVRRVGRQPGQQGPAAEDLSGGDSPAVIHSSTYAAIGPCRGRRSWNGVKTSSERKSSRIADEFLPSAHRVVRQIGP